MSYTVQGSTMWDKARKGLATGVIAYAAGRFILGDEGQSDLFGFNMDSNVALGLSAAGDSVAADLAHDYILPHIPGNEKYANPEAALLGLGTAGAASALIYNQGGVGVPQSMNLFLVGAGSYAAGEYIDRNFLANGGTATLGYF